MNSMLAVTILVAMAAAVNAGGLGYGGYGLGYGYGGYGLGTSGVYGLGSYGGYGLGGYGGYGLGGLVGHGIAYRPVTGLSTANSNSLHYGGVTVLAAPAYSLGYAGAGYGGYGLGYGTGYGIGYGAGYGIGHKG